MDKKLQNIGLLAHVDAGKTSLTENLLYITNQTKNLGSVDKGTTVTDSLPVEKERGISVRAAHTAVIYNGTKINLIDTPGHVDFSAELERSIRIMDGAVIILSAVEGIQAHTFSIWKALQDSQIPCLFFINKTDRPGADTDAIIHQLEKEFNINCIPFQSIQNEGSDDVKIQPLWDENLQSEKSVEALAGIDDDILNAFLEGNIPGFSVLEQKLAKAVNRRQIFPVLAGSAKFSIGIEALLKSINNYLPGANSPDNAYGLSGLIYKVTHHPRHGRIAHTRLYNGQLKVRDKIRLDNKEQEFKVSRILQQTGQALQAVESFETGDIAGICGLPDATPGDIIGNTTPALPKPVSIHSPLLTVQAVADNEKDYAGLASALSELSAEDPALEFEWLKEEQELHVKIMGWIQIQILETLLESRYGIKAGFKNPTVIYKETPRKPGEGFVRYWMPKPCWAILRFKIDPLPRGSGVVYESAIPVDDVHRKYQNEVERTIPTALKQGIKGWEVTDVKITLIEGEDHPVHSRPGDFIVATPMGIMQGLQETGTRFLEPILNFRISAPEELLGNIAGDITQMRGTFSSPEIENGKFILKGKLPLGASLDYPVKLASRSGGKASIHTSLSHYQACDDEFGVEREYRGISPLDTSKYILKARKALQ